MQALLSLSLPFFFFTPWGSRDCFRRILICLHVSLLFFPSFVFTGTRVTTTPFPGVDLLACLFFHFRKHALFCFFGSDPLSITHRPLSPCWSIAREPPGTRGGWGTGSSLTPAPTLPLPASAKKKKLPSASVQGTRLPERLVSLAAPPFSGLRPLFRNARERGGLWVRKTHPFPRLWGFESYPTIITGGRCGWDDLRSCRHLDCANVTQR